MKRHPPKMIVLCAAVTLSASEATAGHQIFLPVAVCQSNASVTDIKPGTYGELINYSGATQEIRCAVGQDHAEDPDDDFFIYYSDKNSVNSRAVFCNSMEVDEDQSSIVFNGGKYSCATAGGCAADPGFYASEGYIRLDNVTHGGTFSAYINCWIPPSPAPGQESAVRTIRLREQ